MLFRSKFQAAGGEDLVAKVVRTFLSDLGERTQAARTAAGQRDGRALGRIGHALKSSSKLVGARSFSALCAELETRAEASERAELDELVERFLHGSAQVQAALRSTLGDEPGKKAAPASARRTASAPTSS